MSELPTPRDYAGLHEVSAACDHCGHIAQLDLAALIASDHGEVALVHLPLRCRQCGKRGHKIIVSGHCCPE